MTDSEKLAKARSCITVALDVPTITEADRLVIRLLGKVGGFKLGLELLTSHGHETARLALAGGFRLMYDGKFHDIPNTMKGAARNATLLGASTFTVHASAGVKAMRAAVEGVDEAMKDRVGKKRPTILAVTVLTSLDNQDCINIFKVLPKAGVRRFANMAVDAGVTGLVCSPQELAVIQEDEHLRQLYLVIPGTRPSWASTDDQARVMTPAEAIRLGANELVIGRPITKPPASIGSPEAAADALAEEIVGAL